MNLEEIIPTKEELEYIRARRQEEEKYQKMMRNPPKVYTHKDVRRTKIRI